MRRIVWVAAGVVALAGAGFAVVTVAGAESGGQYRVASAAVGDVSQTVPVSGTVDRVNRADVSFGTHGTLASLSVAVGDPVIAGQELGTLDTAALRAAVDKAQADLDQAEADLAAAEAAVAEASDDDSDGGSGAADDAMDAVAGLVQEVKDTQSAASAALRTAADAVAAQAAACADPASAACTSAGSATLAAQQAVQAAQDTLRAKLDALASALAAAAQSTSQSSYSAADSAQSESGPAADSAGSVAQAQAAVDEATVQLVEAQQALAGATLTSPVTGTVAAVSAGVGDPTSAGTAVVVVVGEGAAEVSATVPVEQLGKLATGQEATVTPVGTSARLPGTVTRVSTIPDPNAETVVYPVTITVDEPPATLAAGSSATASIVVATAEDVLTVPTSAVSRGTVTVLADNQATVTRVTVGAIGPTRTEIKDGLSAGDQVVLADLSSPLPTSDQQSTGGFLGGGPNGGPAGGGPGGGRVRTGPGN